MYRDLFEYDYTLLECNNDFARLTNVTELIWSHEIESLLQVCNDPKCQIHEKSSDYEKFRALCYAFPYLKRHPLQYAISSLLRSVFNLTLPVIPENCDLIWHECSKVLLRSPLTMIDCGYKLFQEAPRCLTGATEISKLPNRLVPVLWANSLLEYDTASWEEWRTWIDETIALLLSRSGNTIVLNLNQAFTDTKTDLYHVETCLRNGDHSQESQSLRMSQLFWYLAQICQKSALTLLLEIECSGKEILSLLQRTQKSVGLPRIIWATNRADARDNMLDFSMKSHQNSIRWAIRLSDFPADHELNNALLSYAARYPLGALTAVSADDIRYATYQRERLKKSLKQIEKI